MNWAIRERGYSQRRACLLVGLDRKTYRYRSRRSNDAALRERLRDLASVRHRFGYRRLHLLLRREGIALNHKKLYRLYKEEELTVRKRGGRKRALGMRTPMAIPQGLNQRWSLDFVSDALAEGRRFRILCVIDDFSRECLATVVDSSIPGIRVARELDRIAAMRGYPCLVVSDNGTELTSNAILKWQQDRGRRLALRRAGQADAERLCRVIQREAEGRVPQRVSVRELQPSKTDHRALASRLQYREAAYQPRRAEFATRSKQDHNLNRLYS